MLNQDLQQKTSHVNKVIQEIKTTQMQSKVIGSLSKIQGLMTQKLQNTNRKFNVLKNSETDAVLEFMSKDNPSRSRDRIGGYSSNKLAEPSATLQNNATFDVS